MLNANSSCCKKKVRYILHGKIGNCNFIIIYKFEMEVLKPELVWVQGRCYRKLPTKEIFEQSRKFYEDDEETETMVADLGERRRRNIPHCLSHKPCIFLRRYATAKTMYDRRTVRLFREWRRKCSNRASVERTPSQIKGSKNLLPVHYRKGRRK